MKKIGYYATTTNTTTTVTTSIPSLLYCIVINLIFLYTLPYHPVESFRSTSSSNSISSRPPSAIMKTRILRLDEKQRLVSLSLLSNRRNSLRYGSISLSLTIRLNPIRYTQQQQQQPYYCLSGGGITAFTRIPCWYQTALQGNNNSDNNTLRTTLASVLPSNSDHNVLECYESEQTIKKSRFIGLAKHCSSWTDAQSFVSSVRDLHPKARHVCFGFLAGVDPVQERCSDDGEPTGTGGVPILSGIRGENLSDTVCAVVRYSGGIKLGTGGLIRAYGGTARLVLRASTTETLIPTTTFQITTPPSHAGQIYSTVAKFGGTVEGETYGMDGTLGVTVVCESVVVEELREGLRDATRGEIDFLEMDA